MGLAIRTKTLMDLNFPSIIWKFLVNQTITDNDVLAIDVLSFKIIDQLEELRSSKDITPEIMEMMDQHFVVIGTDEKEHELIPNGGNILVTLNNLNEFIQLYRKFRYNEFNLQCDAIKRGLFTVIPYSLLSLLTWEELELLICGRQKFDVELLYQHTSYDECKATDPHILLFWRVMRERFDDIERGKFLKFVWGQSRLPLRGKDFERFFKIQSYHASDSEPSKFLPISHTCFFSIELPKYKTMESMYERLLYAITHCDSIDADGTSASLSNARMAPIIDQDDIQDDEF